MNSIILILMLIVFALVTIFDYIAGRKEQSISDSLISAGITIILSTVSGCTELIILLVIEHLGYSLNVESPNYIVCYITGVLLIVLGIVLKFSFKNRTFILNMFGMFCQKEISNPKAISDLKLSEHKIIEHVVDLSSFFNNFKNQESVMNKAVCQHIKKSAEIFSSKAYDQKSTCFTGMAPIPYTIYMGTYLEKANIDRYFEYNAQDEGHYYELKKSKRRKWGDLKKEYQEKINSNAEEILIAISISHKISDIDLAQFNMDKVKIYLLEPKDNVIKYKEQLKEYKNVIYDCIVNDVMKAYPNLKTIHIAAAIPSCLSIEIGKSIGLRTNRICDIIVHHYVKFQTPPYVWGLQVNGEQKERTLRSKEGIGSV